jgi:NTP pyrophosphatase (non-canonical NTP hydrolase)
MNKLTINQIQEISKKWIKENGFKWSSYAEYCHLVEEVGELGEAIVVKHGERQSGSGEQGDADHDNIEEEIGDVLFSTVVIANRYNLDLEKVFEQTIKRYDEKVRLKNDNNPLSRK